MGKNKYSPKNNIPVNLTKDQRGQFVELQLNIMKARELRRSDHEQKTQAEIKSMNDVGAQFANELGIDVNKYVLNVDTYQFELRQTPLNPPQSQSVQKVMKPQPVEEE